MDLENRLVSGLPVSIWITVYGAIDAPRPGNPPPITPRLRQALPGSTKYNQVQPSITRFNQVKEGNPGRSSFQITPLSTTPLIDYHNSIKVVD
jgi:hypothetical protein